MAKFHSIFDIIGPIMIGPSSSHTAGAVRIGLASRAIFGEMPENVQITFFGSFAHTYKGHGTDLALIGGLLGLSTANPDLRYAYDRAKESGMKVKIVTSKEKMKHPNTAEVRMTRGSRTVSVTGISTGGGSIDLVEIDGFNVHVHNDNPVVLIFHMDRPGVIASVTHIIGKHRLNISQMEVSRKTKGKLALMLIATDGDIPDDTLEEISAVEHVVQIIDLSEIRREPDAAKALMAKGAAQ
ncbi:MAG: L-serine ammonia-lyase, iron-sulfur-dependent, subunit beta [Clostridiaceae bacterium]|jgi:L-serine dehydratase|nr:L-serine ammonia-lyase, iron-sulfur-dependent, subunit beta [Clostridiaceae bacterium]